MYSSTVSALKYSKWTQVNAIECNESNFFIMYEFGKWKSVVFSVMRVLKSNQQILELKNLAKA